MGSLEYEELLITSALQENDPIEQHIIKLVRKLKQQNKRLKEHIAKTGAWANIKEVDLWKPFDFYNYFCSKYVERYGKEYRQTGNLVLAYQRIDDFRIQHKVTKKDYKQFIDKAFNRYFNNVQIPRISHIFSMKLYNMLMSDSAYTSADEYRTLDRELLRESEKFDSYVNEFNSR